MKSIVSRPLRRAAGVPAHPGLLQAARRAVPADSCLAGWPEQHPRACARPAGRPPSRRRDRKRSGADCSPTRAPTRRSGRRPASAASNATLARTPAAVVGRPRTAARSPTTPRRRRDDGPVRKRSRARSATQATDLPWPIIVLGSLSALAAARRRCKRHRAAPHAPDQRAVSPLHERAGVAAAVRPTGLAPYLACPRSADARSGGPKGGRMRCPACGHEDTRVLESRVADGREAVRRRRECVAARAGSRPSSATEEAPLWVVKRDGRRQPFDRAKLLRGLERACAKRPVPLERVEARRLRRRGRAAR